MPTLTIAYSTDAERLAYERAIAFVAEMRQLAQSAPGGGVIGACEDLALSRGRELLRATLATAAQARVDRDEQKGAPPGPARAGPGAATRGGTSVPS
jgi:hypothetical protein